MWVLVIPSAYSNSVLSVLWSTMNICKENKEEVALRKNNISKFILNKEIKKTCLYRENIPFVNIGRLPHLLAGSLTRHVYPSTNSRGQIEDFSHHLLILQWSLLCVVRNVQYSVKFICIVYSMLYSVLCILCSVQCAVCSVQCAV